MSLHRSGPSTSTRKHWTFPANTSGKTWPQWQLRLRYSGLTTASKPDVICDIGHNAHGLRLVFDQLRAVAPGYHHVYIIFGVVGDKDVEAISPLMIGPGGNVSYILTQPSTQRAMPVERLAATLERHGISGISAPTVAEAIAIANKEAAAEDLIFIGGSNFTVSDALTLFP